MIVSVGAPRTPGLTEAIRDYESRISRYFKFESLEVRPRRITRGSDIETIVQKESEDLLGRVPAGLDIVALDQRGASWTSRQLAEYLERLALHGKAGAAFLVGGPLGLSDSLRRTAQQTVSLSSFTLPHEMARLVLAEQIYRAGTIQRGEPYHKGE